MVGKDVLINTTGKGMAKAQGFPDLNFATIPYGRSTTAAIDPDLEQNAEIAAAQVERILMVEAGAPATA